MKIPAYKINVKEIAELKAALVFGPNSDGVEETAISIAKEITPNLKDDFLVQKCTPSDLKNNEGLILDEASTMALLGGRRLIWLKDATDSTLNAINLFLNNCKTDAFLLITADNLTAKSSLRNLCENAQNIATIAVYADSEKTISQNIMQYVAEFGYTIDNGAIQALQNLGCANRLILKSEIEKICTYLGDNKKITTPDILLVCGKADTSIEKLLYALTFGNMKNMVKYYNTLLDMGENPVSINRILINHFNLLLRASCLMPQNYEKAKKLFISFDMQNNIATIVRIWTTPIIKKTLGTLLELDKELKSTGSNKELLISYVLLKLTQYAAKKNY